MVGGMESKKKNLNANNLSRFPQEFHDKNGTSFIFKSKASNNYGILLFKITIPV